MISSIRTPLLIQERLERTEINLMHYKWEVTLTHGNQPNTFWMGQLVLSPNINIEKKSQFKF